MMVEKNCVMVCAGDFREDSIQLLPGDFLIAVDNGLQRILKLGLTPDLILGDFDSLEEGAMAGCADLEALRRLSPEVLRLPVEKDDTDSVYAAREAVRRGFGDFLLIGAAGGRLDHTLGNLSLLLWLESQGKKALLADDFSEMEIVSSREVRIPDSFSYFSLLNISGLARGIRISGAKYPLSDAEIRCDYQYGISNEVLPGETAVVSLREGRLLLIKVY